MNSGDTDECLVLPVLGSRGVAVGAGDDGDAVPSGDQTFTELSHDELDAAQVGRQVMGDEQDMQRLVLLETRRRHRGSR